MDPPHPNCRLRTMRRDVGNGGLSRFMIAMAIAGLAAISSDPGRRARAEELSGETGRLLYVDDDAPAGGDGATWTSAYRFLQDALLAASRPGSGISELHIGQGTYKADQGANQ